MRGQWEVITRGRDGEEINGFYSGMLQDNVGAIGVPDSRNGKPVKWDPGAYRDMEGLGLTGWLLINWHREIENTMETTMLLWVE